MKRLDNINNINIKSVQGHLGVFKYTNDDWGTIAFVIPRNQIRSKFIDKELRYNCIYFLFGYEGTQEKTYVGQACKRKSGESVLARLREHNVSKEDKYRDVWDWVVVFTNKDDTWSSSTLDALEHIFYNIIDGDKLFNTDNPNSGGADIRLYEEKVQQIKSYISIIGFTIFDDNLDESLQSTLEINEYINVEDLHNGLSKIPEIVTPYKIVKEMVDMLPSSVWNDRTVFLDPACKGGEYLKEIYDRLMENEFMKSKYSDLIERSNHILKNQLYGVALSRVSLERTVRKLKGYDNNIIVIPKYVGLVRGIRYGNNIQAILDREFNREMKVDVVIGNPPYQESTGGGQAGGIPLYTDFVRLGHDLNPEYMSFVIPTRWYIDNSRKQSQEIRNILLTSKTQVIVDAPNSEDMFKGVKIQGGVMYFLRSKVNTKRCKVYTYPCNESFETELNTKVFIRDKIASKVYNTIINKNEYTLEKMALKMNPYGLLRSDIGNDVRRADSEVEVLSSHGIGYISRDKIKKNIDTIDKYKVIVGYGITTMNKVITLKMLKPGQVCTLTYCVFGCFDNLSEATRYLEYLKLKFTRYMIRCSIINSSITQENLKFVPMIDLDKIWTDEELYTRYNLTQEEIEHIESTVQLID